MKQLCHSTICATRWVVFGLVCLVPMLAIAGARDMGCSPTLANPCTGGSSGSSSGGNSIGTTLGSAVGKALGEAMFGGGDAEAARRAQEAAAAAAAAAAERQRQQDEADRIERDRQAEAQRQKAAAFIRDRDAAAGTLKGSSGEALSQLKELAGTDEYGLKSSGFDQGGELKSARGADSLVVDTRNEPGGKSDVKNATPAKSTAYSKGFEHASQCISQNAGPTCVGVTADQQQICVADYRGGYDSGSIQRKLVLQEAYQAGHDAAARGELANGASDQRAQGPCRTEWIMAYNRGHFGAKAPSIPDKIKPTRTVVDARNPEVTRIINAMNALAKKLGWNADEQARLDQALNNLVSDGDGTSAQSRQAWQNVLARGQGKDFARDASQGDGPGFPGAGTQSHQDCAVFALANASGLPYGVVATRATELMRQGEWRDAAERANPQRVIEQKGLIGGEVVMVAEALGQAEVVTRTDFAKTLKEGRPVMVHVVPVDGDFRNGHEVVLTKVFQRKGETWYEMMDSNQGPQQRLYVSAQELSTIQKENGVAFRPEPGTVAKRLR